MSTISKLLFSLICLLASGLANAADEPPTIGGTSAPSFGYFTQADVTALTVYAGSATTTLTCEYGTTAAYGSTQAYWNTLSAGSTLSYGSITLRSLTPGTLYHYRFKAQNSVNTAYTADGTFTTPTPPTFATLAATNVTDLSVKLNGTVTPYSNQLIYTFEWGTTTAYGQTAYSIQGATNNIRAATVTSLLPSTSYHYRLMASTAYDVFYGEDQVFTTSAAATPPVINSTSASSESPYSAALFVGFNTGSSPATASFQYGLTSAYGSEANYSSTLDTNLNTNASVLLTNLTAGTTYHYQVKMENAQGTVYSTDRIFTTLVPPTLTTTTASAVTDLTATLNGTVNPGGANFNTYFEWGPTVSYGNVASANYVTGTATAASSLNITGLLPGTIYHFRIKNNAGTYFGSDMTFTTAAPATPPTVAYASFSSVEVTSVRLASSFNTGSSAATLSFEYGPTISYGSETVSSSTFGTINRDYYGTVDLTNLTPGTTYHWRAKIVNGQGTTYSSAYTFTTLSLPVLTTTTATAITDLSATLNSTINANGSSITSYFDWGLTNAYGNSVYADYTSSMSTVAVSKSITGLLPSTTYHFRIRSHDSTYFGSDMTFTTSAPATPPTITASSSSSITTSSASINASVLTGSSPPY